MFGLMLLSAAGLILSLAVHLASLLNMPVPGGSTVWVLHVGIFVVWIPAVLVLRRNTRFADQKDLWKAALQGSPLWMRRTLYALMGYAVVNFIIYMLSVDNTVSSKTPGVDLRGFSGHWMVFYGSAFLTFYSAVKSPGLLRDRRCARGHLVSPVAQFCPECGDALPKPSTDASQETHSK